MLSLDQALAGLTSDADAFTLDAPEAWGQGRTLYGGITAALCLTAARRRFADLPPLRSAQFAFVGPAAGALAFHPVLLRKGRSSTIAGVDCRSEEGVAARATFVFGEARESVVAHDRVPRLRVPPPDACEPFMQASPVTPAFAGRFDYRIAAGTRLFQPGEPPEFTVWARLRDGNGQDPAAALLAFGDCLPAAAMTNFPRPAPISTMTWQIDFHQPLQPLGSWHLIWSSSEAARDGYSLQTMRVLAEDGTPLASARQVVALFA